MLILSRRVDESIVIGGDIEVKVLRISGGQVQLGIKAARHIAVHRQEIHAQIQRQNKLAIETSAGHRDKVEECFRDLQGKFSITGKSADSAQPDPTARQLSGNETSERISNGRQDTVNTESM